jgi:hypothetical protein
MTVTMNLPRWFATMMLVSAACARDERPDAPDAGRGSPVGFTFQTAEGGFSSFGWSGQLHRVTGAVGTPFGVKTTACDDHGVCRFEGPSAPASPVDRRRCLFRTSQTCASDADCLHGAQGSDKDYTPCVYIYDAPIATPLVGGDGKVGACSWSYIPVTAPDGKPSIRGTLNLNSGALNLEDLTVLLPLNGRAPAMPGGPGGFAGVCPECVGDIAPNDGRKDGTCRLSTHVDGTRGVADPGLDLGMPCDVHRYGTIPGYDGGYSIDCSARLTRGLGQPTQFGGSFTSSGYTATITEDSPNCTAPGFEGEKCFCGMCADGVTACMSSADCGGGACGNPDTRAACDPNPYPSDDPAGYNPALPIHQCKQAPIDPAKFAVAGNACVDGTCTWDEDRNIGTCKSKLNPALNIGCYPSGVGKSIVAQGRARRVDSLGTVYYADTATARCTAASRSAPLNSQLGLPGLQFQKRNFVIIPAYAEDPR